MASQLSEENLVLYPAVYNRKGLLGDFEVMILSDDSLAPLSGRTGPYTSVSEWFNGAGKSILRRDPEYVLAALKPGVGPDGQLSGSQGTHTSLYRISRDDASSLDAIAQSLEPVKQLTVM